MYNDISRFLEIRIPVSILALKQTQLVSAKHHQTLCKLHMATNFMLSQKEEHHALKR